MTAPESPAVFEPGGECLPEAELAVLQEIRLRELVDRLLAVPGGLQAARLRAAGVTSGAGLTLADLPGLPTTGKQDLWDAYPLGLLAVPREDLRLWARMCARALVAAGATAASTVHNAYGYVLFTGGLGIHQGAVELGATVVPASGGMTARQVTLLSDLRPHILT